MPFVFVHGVNVRAGSDHDRDEKLRNAFLTRIVAPAVGISPESEIHSPYWGKDGTSFWRNLEVVPGAGGVETFGPADALPPSVGFAVAEGKVGKDDTIDVIAKKAPDVAIDLLWDYAATDVQSEEDFHELAAAYGRAIEKLESGSGGEWLAETSAAELADDVFMEVRPTAAETYGGTGLLAMLEEGSRRLALKPADALSHAAVAAARKPLTRKIATFIGDAFQYLAERGDGKEPGPIALAVLQALQAGKEDAKAKGEPLVVICHSFGGEIVYDILTHHAPDLAVDTWITIGSQVGLFEEMSLLLASPRRVKPHTVLGNEAIASPTSVTKWINIVDANDVLGFLVLPVFTGNKPGAVRDFMYDTGYPVTGAHSGYFEWPSFYKRLAARLKQP